MDKTLLLLFIVSGLLLAVLAPHATLTLAAVIALSVITTRIIWAIVRSFEDSASHRAVD
ncbi:MAG: hypothetical protein AAF722_17955 [Cyanobacteria bacterium P01_C01_bin.70]